MASALLNLKMKMCNSTFNAEGSRFFIIVVQIGAVKIYGASVEALRKMKRQDETQFTPKLVEKLVCRWS
jgi:hypothetical protein